MNIYFLTVKSLKLLVLNSSVFYWESKNMSIWLFYKHLCYPWNPKNRYTFFGSPSIYLRNTHVRGKIEIPKFHFLPPTYEAKKSLMSRLVSLSLKREEENIVSLWPLLGRSTLVSWRVICRNRGNFTHVTAQHILGRIFTYRVSHEKKDTSSGGVGLSCWMVCFHLIKNDQVDHVNIFLLSRVMCW